MFLAAIIFTITFLFLVLIHELGHYVAAKACGMSVIKFSIGFGKPIWRWKEFVIARFPLGGYVTLADSSAVSWQKRTIVILAGSCANFLVAILLYWFALGMGITHVRPIVGYVTPGSIAAKAGIKDQTELPFVSWSAVGIAFISHLGDSTPFLKFDLSHWRLNTAAGPDWLTSLGLEPAMPAEKLIVQEVNAYKGAAHAGIKSGDIIVAAQDKPVRDRMMLLRVAKPYIGQSMRLTFEREGRRLHAMVPVGWGGTLGVIFSPVNWPSEALRVEQGGLKLALQHTWEMAVFNVKVLIKLIQGEISLQSLSGPLGILAGAWLSFQQGFPQYLSFLALISIGLGIINLLPIPGLDGARLIYLIWPPSPAVELLAFRLGMILLILLTIHVFIGDILRLLLH